jgi:hypothetical protein
MPPAACQALCRKSHTPGWLQDRGRCLDEFAALYGGLPLRVRQLAGGGHARPWLLRLAPVVERLHALARGHL